VPTLFVVAMPLSKLPSAPALNVAVRTSYAEAIGQRETAS
jgi:hypothetical protein